MNTVITHFYNEEYMLPWWIKHHSKIFDNGILIDSNSTYNSFELSKELCPPHWKVVKTVYKDNFFSANDIDHEVKCYENTVDGFKIALTTAEFLFVPASLNSINEFIIKNNFNYLKTIGICMVDIDPNDLPLYNEQLYARKHHGMITGYSDPTHNFHMDTYNYFYGRHYHNKPYGDYALGRHWVNGGYENNCISDDLFTLKYKYSPWNDNTIKRVKQFASKVPPVDIERGLGLPHLQTDDQHQFVYNHFLSTADDLKKNQSFLNAYNYCMRL
jgi:hypothetical protein